MRFNKLVPSLVLSLVACVLLAYSVAAHADAVATLQGFLKDVKSGRAQFTQVVTAPDGKHKKTSSGSFEFQRPNQFVFNYAKPFEQSIVADGSKVWIYDPDLNQASSRKIDAALGATPAAILAGGNSVERDFELKDLPSEAGIDWVQATPRAKEGSIQSLRVGFKGQTLAALEIIDAFGQTSRLDFDNVLSNVAVPAEHFRFVLPAGADLIEQ